MSMMSSVTPCSSTMGANSGRHHTVAPGSLPFAGATALHKPVCSLQLLSTLCNNELNSPADFSIVFFILSTALSGKSSPVIPSLTLSK
eukprot:CAMPEP_0177773320 /NCGR_PEP_ID=MMETSP0491_2-20121128/12776_1 /TAXON_ID=63592 /ORGANISM="Tetraselmis chuii, Strain PLY429" /LENGTH=87 /DNA_ID=CAMNT_0019291355 /DNA_START=144 /DNA_END=404 /DNA_ORIENTATION=+